MKLKAQRFVAGIGCFSGKKEKKAMKFEISGFYSSGGLFQAQGPGKW